jgi:hypothetical protein
MIEIRKADERGHANHGWLDTYHTFSFADYYDPKQMHFRVLRVINEDRIAAGAGFGTHPHNNMEIITYVVAGQVAHKDSMGTGSVINAGEFQLMSAGSGVTHSEFNPSKTEPTHLYQIWIMPDKKNVTPKYQQKALPINAASGKLHIIVSRDGANDTLQANQDIKLYFGKFKAGDKVALPLIKERYGWLQVISGALELEGVTLNASDGAALSGMSEPAVVASTGCEVLYFDLP